MMKEHVTQFNTWLTDVFGQHWSFVAQRNKIYQALNTQIILVRIHSLLVLFFSWDLLTVRKI